MEISSSPFQGGGDTHPLPFGSSPRLASSDSPPICLGCGSRYFIAGSNGKQCRICGWTEKKLTKKPTVKTTHKGHVVSGPARILGLHGIGFFDVPVCKFAIARKDVNSNGVEQDRAMISLLLDSYEVAKTMASKIEITTETEAIEPVSTGLDTFDVIGNDFNDLQNNNPYSNKNENDIDKVEIVDLIEDSLQNDVVTFVCDSCLGVFGVNTYKTGASRNLLSCPRCANIITRCDE